MLRKLYILLLLALVACEEQKKTTPVTEVPESKSAIVQPTLEPSKPGKPEISLAGMVFELGHQKERYDCLVENECDCCLSDLTFLSATQFIMSNYCTGEERVVKGTYSLKADRLTLHYDPVAVDYDYNWEQENDSTAVPYLLSSEKVKIPKDQFSVEKCLGKVKLKATGQGEKEIAVPKIGGSLAYQISSLKEKGVLKEFKTQGFEVVY